ncbi:hypothetical protein IAT38_006316 [Cryptococcus sp. DSM 104549]
MASTPPPAQPRLFRDHSQLTGIVEPNGTPSVHSPHPPISPSPDIEQALSRQLSPTRSFRNHEQETGFVANGLPPAPRREELNEVPSPDRTVAPSPTIQNGHAGRSDGNKAGTGTGDEKGDRYLMTFDSWEDKRNAQNWPLAKKVFQTALLTLVTFYAGCSSAVLDGANVALQEHFGISEVVASLCNGMYVIGFAAGPQVFGPASEVMGRKWPLVGGIFVSATFSIMSADARNIATVLLGRFFGGMFGSAPYAIVGGCFHDMWDELHVQASIACFASSTAGGPALGPIIGAGLASTSVTTGWRWAGWFQVIFGFACALILAVFMEESYAPRILQAMGRERRAATGNWAWHAELDMVVLTPRDVFVRYVLRPVKMLFTEPMLLVITIYMSFVYSLLYMLFAAVPIIYGEMRGWSNVSTTLPFISVFIGILVGGMCIMLDMHRYAAKLRASGRESWPEQRFVPMGLGAIMLVIGFFWFAFTGPAQSSSAWPSIVALGFSMCGMVLIFECGIIYIIDMYGPFTNSAIAANTLMRSIVGGTFPLFTPAMVHNLGYQSTWAMTLLAFLALLMAPIPIIFFHTGERIRALSKFRPEL